MSSVEEKLREYRRRKEENEMKVRRKETVWYLLTLQWIKEILTPQPPQVEEQKPIKTSQQPKQELKTNLKEKLEPSIENYEEDENIEEINESEQGYMSWYYFTIKFLLYAVLQAIFIELEFGAVFFIVAGFYLMWTNMGKRKQGEASAYSVFNPNCESIDGTLTAQQFENEIRHRNIAK